MYGKKIANLLFFLVATCFLIKSKVFLNLADNAPITFDRTCRQLNIECTGNDYNLALMIAALIINVASGLIIVFLFNALIKFMTAS